MKSAQHVESVVSDYHTEGLAMRLLGLVLVAGVALWGGAAHAQASNAKVVAACGGASLPLGSSLIQMDQTGALCTNATGGGGGGSVTQGTTPWVDNITQVGGTNISVGTGAQGSGSPRVTVATDTATNAGSAPTATGAAVPANTNYIGTNVAGNLTGVIGCGSSVIYDTNTNGKTQLVALSSGKITYVCGYTITTSSATTVTVSLSSGTGTNCGSTSTNITPAYPIQNPASQGPAGIVDGSPFYRGLKTAASEELCLVTTAGVSVQAIVYYTTF